MGSEIILTSQGFKELTEKYEDLVKVKRAEAAQRVKEAREFGDLSENAEYDAAKDAQGMIEGKIKEIEQMLKNAVVIDEENIDTKTVSAGCYVKIFDEEYNEKQEYQIVGVAEASYADKRISNDSPLGAALIGRKKGDTVTVSTPAGIMKYKVLGIRKQ